MLRSFPKRQPLQQEASPLPGLVALMQAEVKLGLGVWFRPQTQVSCPNTRRGGKASRQKPHSLEEAREQQSGRLKAHSRASRCRDRGWLWGHSWAPNPQETRSSPLHPGAPAQPPDSWVLSSQHPIMINHGIPGRHSGLSNPFPFSPFTPQEISPSESLPTHVCGLLLRKLES